MNDNSELQTELYLRNARITLEKSFDTLIHKNCSFKDDNEKFQKSFLENMLIYKINFTYTLYEKNFEGDFKEALYMIFMEMYQQFEQSLLKLSELNTNKIQIMLLTWLLIVNSKDELSIQRDIIKKIKSIKDIPDFFQNYLFKIPMIYLIKEEMNDILIQANCSIELIKYFQSNCGEIKLKRKYPQKNEKENKKTIESELKINEKKYHDYPKHTTSFEFSKNIITSHSMNSYLQLNEDDIQSQDKDKRIDALPKIEIAKEKTKYIRGINAKFPKPQITHQINIKKHKEKKGKLIEKLFNKCKSSEFLLVNNLPIKKEGDRTKLRKMITGGFYSKDKFMNDIESKSIFRNIQSNNNSKSQDSSNCYELLNVKKNKKKREYSQRHSIQNSLSNDNNNEDDIILAFKTPKRFEEQNITGININQNNVKLNYLQLLNQKNQHWPL